MTKISMSNILDVKFEEFNIDELDPECGIKMEECVHSAMREACKVSLGRALQNFSTGVKYDKSDIEKVIKLTLKELE